MGIEEKIDYIVNVVSGYKGIEDHDIFKSKLRKLNDKELKDEYEMAQFIYAKTLD